MGKRKSSKPVKKKSSYTLLKEFDCPFCNFRKCVEAKLCRSLGFATIKCRVCKINNESKINHLSEPADVYCDWLDACEKVNEEDSIKDEENNSINEDIEITKKIKK